MTRLKIIHTKADWQAHRPSGTVGFVPTMGALHAGHIALVQQALAENTHIITSIYVNPTQFDNAEDLAKYPATFDEDCALLEASGCKFVFAPTYATLYPDSYRVRVSETEISQTLEGAHRPGHFNGMLTVVLKLLNFIGADVAYFGEKDFQQLTLVREMVAALHHPTRIVACPTVREADGLAMSSRNRRLDAAQRLLATHWSQILADLTQTCPQAKAKLESLGFTVDYIEESWGRRLGAVYVPAREGQNRIRLIDNVALPNRPKR